MNEDKVIDDTPLEFFKFYRSYRDAIDQMKPMDKLSTLLAIVDYALYGTEPNLKGMPLAVFTVARPTIDTNKKKAKAGNKGGRPKKETNGFENDETIGYEKNSYARLNQEYTKSNQEDQEGQRDTEIDEDPPITPHGGTAFDQFWKAYPKKVGKQAAMKAFQRVKAPLETLLTAIDRQKRGDQWSRENGRFIPNPATWLNQGRWDDEVTTAQGRNAVKAAADYDGDEEAFISCST